MKDQELYDIIKKIVKEKNTISHRTQPTTFAEKYCNLQLRKKKLTPHHINQKMKNLMKNFNNLDTYINLPELLACIRQVKLKRNHVNFSNCQNEKEKIKGSRVQTSKSISSEKVKNFNDLNNLKYTSEHQVMKEILKQIEEDLTWSNDLKNHSGNSIGHLLTQIHEEKNSFNSKNSNEIFQNFNKSFLNKPNFQSQHCDKIPLYMETNLNSEIKKQNTKFLHKVSSYLQIVLETEHKAKWGLKTYKTQQVQNFREETSSCYQPKQFLVQNSKVKNVIKCKLREKKLPPVLKGQSLHENMKQNLNLNLFEILEEGRHKKQLDGQIKLKKNMSKQSVRQSQIKDIFTFRRRSIKQKIITKINKFIGQIDEEEHTSKKENRYYFDEINKLEENYNELYNRHRRETLASDQDVQNLKRMASTFQVTNSPTRSPQNEREQNVIGANCKSVQ